MQPLWIQVKNGEDLPYWFFPSGLDPAYFSASEGAYAFRSPTSDEDSRGVLFIEQRQLALSEIEFLEWDRLADHYRQQPGRGETKINP